jgi:hypothetical protein
MATAIWPSATTRILAIAALALALCGVTIIANTLQQRGSLSRSWLEAIYVNAPWPYFVAAACVGFALLAALSASWPRTMQGVLLGALSAFSLVMFAQALLALSALPRVGYPVLWRDSARQNLPLIVGLALAWLAWFRWRRSGGSKQLLLIWWLCVVFLNAPLPAILYFTF